MSSAQCESKSSVDHFSITTGTGACGSAVGSGTMLQARKHVMNYNKEENMKSDNRHVYV
jgi:hypothetical protein